MVEQTLKPTRSPLTGEITVPGDKSISHRAVMLASLAKGTTTITNFLFGEDCIQTIEAFRSLGVDIDYNDSTVTIRSKGAFSLNEPKTPLYFGNSGTTARLMIGILSGLPFMSVVYGDPFLTVRPMDRVVKPLRSMGALIDGRENGAFLPLAIRGGNVSGITYEMPVKSAQVKSAILLAGLFANNETKVIETVPTRNHTENMLKAFGADIHMNQNEITITNKNELKATDVQVPGDISSAAFLLVAAAIIPYSTLTLKEVGLNKTRSGIIDVLHAMGANITILNEKVKGGERFGDIAIKYASLKGIVIEGEIIPRLIDEIPIIALLATQAEGTTVIRDAEELRVKETDRIEAIVDVLSTLGANIEGTDDGLIIKGKTNLNGGNIRSYHDHRIAMMGAIGALIASSHVTIDDISSINVSYPHFFDHVQQLIDKS